MQELFSFNDLPAVNSSPNDVRQKFNTLFGKNPDGICVNSETYYNAVTPAITQQYGHPCYKTVGQLQYSEGATGSPTSAIVGSQYAINNSSETVSISVGVTGNWNETTSWTTSTTVGLTFSEEISIEGVFKMGTSFSVSTTLGKSDSKSAGRSATTTATVPVPPKSKIKVSMVATMQQETLNFTGPIGVQGMFGANFPDRVNGHYFWFSDATSILPTVSGTLNGSISNTYAMSTQTEIGEVEPI
jgi:hypothetical protein